MYQPIMLTKTTSFRTTSQVTRRKKLHSPDRWCSAGRPDYGLHLRSVKQRNKRLGKFEVLTIVEFIR